MKKKWDGQFLDPSVYYKLNVTPLVSSVLNKLSNPEPFYFLKTLMYFTYWEMNILLRYLYYNIVSISWRVKLNPHSFLISCCTVRMSDTH